MHCNSNNKKQSSQKSELDKQIESSIWMIVGGGAMIAVAVVGFVVYKKKMNVGSQASEDSQDSSDD